MWPVERWINSGDCKRASPMSIDKRLRKNWPVAAVVLPFALAGCPGSLADPEEFQSQINGEGGGGSGSSSGSSSMPDCVSIAVATFPSSCGIGGAVCHGSPVGDSGPQEGLDLQSANV